MLSHKGVINLLYEMFNLTKVNDHDDNIDKRLSLK